MADSDQEQRRPSGARSGADAVDEYTQLQKYISTYRDSNADAGDSSGGGKRDKKQWWKFWKSNNDGCSSSEKKQTNAKEVPAEWVETDIRQGITDQEVNDRRKRFGWNELTTEKENMFLKFFTYFTGPILYGMSTECAQSYAGCI